MKYDKAATQGFFSTRNVKVPFWVDVLGLAVGCFMVIAAMALIASYTKGVLGP